jgi:Coenzyme PQQ synthesis protein D (PqqD)
MPDSALPKPVEGVVHRELDGAAVLVHLGTNQIYSLNETGSVFWALLAEGKDRHAIRAQLLDEFEVAPEEVDGEIDKLLADLGRAGLVA